MPVKYSIELAYHSSVPNYITQSGYSITTELTNNFDFSHQSKFLHTNFEKVIQQTSSPTEL
jgi:hypothetical protein